MLIFVQIFALLFFEELLSQFKSRLLAQVHSFHLIKKRFEPSCKKFSWRFEMFER